MFLGHYAVAMAAKPVAPKASLGALVLGAQFLDLLWPVLLLTGTERVRIEPGAMEANALVFEHYPFSHGLAVVAVWAVAVAVIYAWTTRYRVGAVVVGSAVLSHWFLDLPMHAPDLPLAPGLGVRLGGGLWNSLEATLALELGLLALGIAIYGRATEARDGVGRWGYRSMVAVLVVFFLGGALGPPPPSESALAFTALGLGLFVPWAYLVDRHRRPRSTPPGSTAQTDAGVHVAAGPVR